MKETGVRAALSAALAGFCSYFGILAAPLTVLIAVMLADYATGMLKAWESSSLSSRIGIRGILKKLGYLVIVAVGMVVDWILRWGLAGIGLTLHLTFLISMIVAVWLIINECISILENVAAMGAPVPAFLMKLIDRLKGAVEKEGDKPVGEERGQDA
ncbi:MAG: phage holin family protein [Clostridiales bacterium]|nr:phage holin family protein [Clostridiales bacterium]